MKDLEHEGFMGQGIQTFMKSPYVSLAELPQSQADVAFLGVPLDYNASYRRGAAEAPNAIRRHSYWDRVQGREYVDLRTGKTLVANDLRLVDMGDIHIAPTQDAANHERIQDRVSQVRKHCLPLVVGGDHSIAYSTIRGCKEALPPEQQERFGVLHLDAHFDMEGPYLDMPKVFHGNPFRHLIEEGVVDGSRHVCIGQRGIVPKYLTDFVREHAISVTTAYDLQRRGINDVITETVERLKRTCSAVYVSFDIDALDPREVKGTGTPMEGGMSAEQAQLLLRSLKELPVVGFELVEVAPSLDPTGFTNIVACNLLWQFLAFGLNPKNSSDQKTL